MLARLATVALSASGRRAVSMAMSSSATAVPLLPLNDGTQHPQLGYGTYKVGFVPASASASAAGDEKAGQSEAVTARECVRIALDVGYRFLDCAQFYGNEHEVGAAIQDSGVPRDELFLASKCWTDTIYAGPAAVRAQVLKTIEDLGCGYVDLYCIHWPVPGKHVEAYLELQRLQQEGLIRSLGVSNYVVEDYQELMASPEVTVQPTINQIEINPFLYRRNTVAFFEHAGVKLQAYRALRDGKAFDDPTVCAVAQRVGKTPAQVLGRWCVQKGFIYLPKSVKQERMIENSQVFDFELMPEDMAELDALTTADNLATFEALYRKCVFRDTPAAGQTEGIKTDITVD